MQSIGELDEDYLDVLYHGQDHLAEILGLPFFMGLKADLADLGHPIYQMGDFVAEALLDFRQGSQGVLHGIVEQTGGDGGHIELHLGQNPGHFERVDEIGFTRTAHLSLVDLGREDIGLLQEPQVCRGIVRFYLFSYVIKSKHLSLYYIPRFLKGQGSPPPLIRTNEPTLLEPGGLFETVQSIPSAAQGPLIARITLSMIIR
jgi:hypothetical protein